MATTTVRNNSGDKDPRSGNVEKPKPAPVPPVLPESGDKDPRSGN